MFLDEFKTTVPFDALKYLTAECNYGGRVTDDKDVRLIKSILKKYMKEEILIDGFKFSPSGLYISPKAGE